MKKAITILILLAALADRSFSQDRKIPAISKIERVIVFQRGAQIERTASVSIPAGISVVEFKGLSSDIDEQSIQVKGTGSFTVLSVNRQSDFLTERIPSSEAAALGVKIEAARAELEVSQNRAIVLRKEEAMLDANQSVGNEGAGMDLNRLRQALEFHKSRYTENKAAQTANQKKIADLAKELTALETQLRDINAKASMNTSDVVVKLDSKTASSGTFQLTYLVKNAGWFPSYDLRATEVNRPIDLVYRANISQRSGEEWNNVKLVLSSGDPSRGGNKPELKPYLVGYNLPIAEMRPVITNVTGRITDNSGNGLTGAIIRVKGTSIAANADAAGSYSIQIPAPNATLTYSAIGYEEVERIANTGQINVRLSEAAKALNEVAVTGYNDQLAGKVAGVGTRIMLRGTSSIPTGSAPLEVAVQQAQTTVQFEVAQPYSIASDGKQLTVELSGSRLDADYTYHAVPKISPDAYLTAAVTGISELNLMSGEANIFFEGAFLGKTLINVQNTSDTLSVSLGVDKNLVVKRTRLKDDNERSFTGATQRATRTFSYELLNRKAVPVKVNLEDQVPVSNSSDVTVERLETSGARVNDSTGSLNWNFELQPNERKELRLKYQVRYPRARPVRVE